MEPRDPSGADWKPRRFLDLTLGEPARDLAVEDALLAEMEATGEGIVRAWESPTTCVVLGASSKLREDVDVAACDEAGVPILRRGSGGGTVVIGPGALNLTITAPIASHPALRAVDRAQRFLMEQLAEALRDADPRVQMLGSGDLAIGERKFCGSAQRRLRRGLLVHLSLLYRFDLPLIFRLLRIPARQPEYRRGRVHEDFIANLGLPREAILAAARAAWGRDLSPDDPEIWRDRAATATPHYADPAWVGRF